MANNTGSGNAHACQLTFKLVFMIAIPFLVRFLSNMVRKFILPRARTCSFSGATRNDLRTCA